MKRLCAKMAQAPRAFLVAGMSSLCFGFTSTWDAMVEKYVWACRGYRIGTASGEEFFSTPKHPDGASCHFLAPDGQDEKIANFHVECMETIIVSQPSESYARNFNIWLTRSFCGSLKRPAAMKRCQTVTACPFLENGAGSPDQLTTPLAHRYLWRAPHPMPTRRIGHHHQTDVK